MTNTDEFNPDRQRQVEEYLGRKLEAHELITVSSLAELTSAQREVVRTLALKHRLVCMIYLCGVVEGLLIRDAFALIDAIASRTSESATRSMRTGTKPVHFGELQRALRNVEADPATAVTAACSVLEAFLKHNIARERLLAASGVLMRCRG